jgi:hypothetical protein
MRILVLMRSDARLNSEVLLDQFASRERGFLKQWCEEVAEHCASDWQIISELIVLAQAVLNEFHREQL